MADCPNCTLDALNEKLSPFEAFCVNWFAGHSGAWAMKAGIVPGEFARTCREYKIHGQIKTLFVEAIEEIYACVQKISRDMAKARNKSEAS